MQLVTRNPGLTFAAMLSTLAASVCAAADAAAPPVTPAAVASQLPAQETGIDEIWVQGKRLTELIVDAEDELFELYNKANKNSDYDIHCGTMSLSTGSMIMIRKCVPGFIVYNSYSAMNNTVSLGSDSYDSCASAYPVTSSNGEMAYYGGGFCSSGSGYARNTGYAASPVRLLIMERGPAYANNVERVVSSDPHMVSLANHLVDMYDELESLHYSYVDARKAGQRLRKGLLGTRPVGPRVR